MSLGSPTYCRIAQVLERYVSKLMVQAVLAKAMEGRYLTAHTLKPRDAKHLVEDAMVSLRLFCPTGKLPDLMIELAEACDAIEAGR